MAAAHSGWQADMWSDAQQQMVLRSAGVMGTLALVATGLEFARGQYLDLRVPLLALALGGLSVWTALAERPSPDLRARVQAGLWYLTPATGYMLLGTEWLGMVLPIVVVAVGLLVGPWTSIALAATTFLVYSLHPLPGLVLPQALVLCVVSGLVGLTLTREIRRALFGAWEDVEHNAGLAQNVRLRQAEVVRLNKALRTANGLLKRSLRELGLAQKEAEEARYLKEQFATTVSHELRTPLNVILGFLDVMQRYPNVYGQVNWTPALRRDISEMQRSASYLSDLVDDILDLARIQALKMPIHREHTELEGLIREAVDLCARLLRDKPGVKLTLDLAGHIPTLYIDRTRIRQVLFNLLANACRFTEQGDIRIAAVSQGSEVVVSVSDNGPGIPPEQLEAIFGEFRQVGAGSSGGQLMGGTGLGLAIARRFVQMHGGRVWAESEVGRGSIFHFSLPLQVKQVVNLAPPPSLPSSGENGERLIVLVDGEAGQKYLTRHLENCRIVQVPDLQAARRMVRELHPDAVVLNTPPEPAEVAQTVALSLLPESVPVVSCSFPTGYPAEPSLFDDWLVKPVDSGKLMGALARFPLARRLLVVDDDHSFVRLIRRILEAEGGYEVSWAYDGEQALAKLREQPPDALLIDLALPGLGGREVARAVRSSGKNPPVAIAVTAVRPGEGLAVSARTFTVSSLSGLSEEDTLSLLHACLEQLRPHYTADPVA